MLGVHWARTRRTVKRIRDSGLFDHDHYLRSVQGRDPEACPGIDPVRHYVTRGWREGRDPNPFFHTRHYLENNPDVAAAGANPMLHFLERGWKEGRDPCPDFDVRFYLESNPDVAASGINPLLHYLREGRAQGRPAKAVRVALPDPEALAERGLNVLLVLYEHIGSNSGVHAQLHAQGTMENGADCLFAVPRMMEQSSLRADIAARVHTFARLAEQGVRFADGRGPDIIHAWTPREVVRLFCEPLLARHGSRLVIHLEDNEEYLTEVRAGRPFAELARLPEKRLRKLVPVSRFHPVRGPEFLNRAHGLTMIIETLSCCNTRGVPSLLLPAPVDARLFSPRPLNLELRARHGIPEQSLVLAYTGNVHAGNHDEVLELYKAVALLNREGCPTVLLRTGDNARPLACRGWDSAWEVGLGWVEREELPGILAAADILVQPGAPGPFNDRRIPSKLPEYFATGRPVILPRANLGLEAEHRKEAWVLDSGDARDIADAILAIRDDPGLAAALVQGAARFHSRGTGQLGTLGQRLYAFYRDLCVERRIESN